MTNTGSEDWVTGRRVWAFSSGAPVLDPLVEGLVDLGAQVEAKTDAFDTQQAADDAVALLGSEGDAPDLAVISVLPDCALPCRPLAELSANAWRAAAVDGLRAAMHLLRALGPVMKPRGGAIVLVGPSLSLVGCPELVALSTLLEGQRGMVKSVARQWGSTGVTLNWLAVAPRALSPHFDAAPLAAKPDAVSVALGAPSDLRTQVAPFLAFLASPAGRAMTGATLMLDGGEWMVP